MKKCPFCAEEIQDGAKFCRFCKQWLKETERTQQKQKSSNSLIIIIGLTLVIMAILLLSNEGFHSWLSTVLQKSQSTEDDLVKATVETRYAVAQTSTPKRTPTWKATPFPIGETVSLKAEFSFPKGAVSAASTWDTDKDWTEFAEYQARNLAIPHGSFEWSFAELPRDTTYREVEQYYLGKLKSSGYQLLISEQGRTYGGSNEVFLLKMRNDSYYFLAQFWGAEGGFPPMVLVYRWNK